MIITYQNIIVACWAIFIIVWGALAFNVKRDIRGSYGNASRQFWQLRFVAAIVLIFFSLRIATARVHYANSALIFSYNIFPRSLFLGWTAAVLSVVGLSFAIWARVHLGRNWSSRPAVKEHHELVTTGPYAYVRHPIYTGIIMMAFATALTVSIFGIGVFVIASFTYISRIGKEEKIMLELFPKEYPEYRKRTKALIPFVL